LLYCPSPLVICLSRPSTQDKLIIYQASHCCCCNVRLAKSLSCGHLIGISRLHCCPNGFLTTLCTVYGCCVCSKQTDVGIHVQIISLTGNVLTSCYSTRRNYSIKWYAVKWAINARKSTFGFWFYILFI